MVDIHGHDRLRPQALARPLLAARHGTNFCLARANGWGLVGECPAGVTAKTPTARTGVSRVAAVGLWPATLYARRAVQQGREGVA